MPEPFATLSRRLRELSASQHGYDGTWGRMTRSTPSRARGLVDVEAWGEVWTMHGGTDSAEWYVAALERALDVLPADVFPPGFEPRDAIAQARAADFAILSPISVMAYGRRPEDWHRRAE